MKKATNTAKRRVDEDGNVSWDISTTFDVTEEGIVFGQRRNYNPNFIKRLVNSKATKQALAGGFSTIMYGHQSREERYGMFAMEHHPITGLPQFPLGHVTDAKIHSKWLTLKMTITEAENNNGKTIVQLMKNGIGGFSTHFSLKDEMLQGVDYVLSRNFFDNRVEEFLTDSIGHVCNGGECTLDVTLREEAEGIVGNKTEFIPDVIKLLEANPIIKKATTNIAEVEELQAQLKNFKRELESANITIGELERKLYSANAKVSRMKEPIVREVEKIVTVEVESQENKKLMDSLKVELKKRGVTFSSSSTTSQVEVEVEVEPTLFDGIFRDSFIEDGRRRRILDEERLGVALGLSTKKASTQSSIVIM